MILKLIYQKKQVQKIRKVCLKHKINIIIITSATSFLDIIILIFLIKNIKKFYLNFYLYDLTERFKNTKLKSKQ